MTFTHFLPFLFLLKKLFSSNWSHTDRCLRPLTVQPSRQLNWHAWCMLSLSLWLGSDNPKVKTALISFITVCVDCVWSRSTDLSRSHSLPPITCVWAFVCLPVCVYLYLYRGVCICVCVPSCIQTTGQQILRYFLSELKRRATWCFISIWSIVSSQEILVHSPVVCAWTVRGFHQVDDV